MTTRVVVTGIGVVTAAGAGRDALWNAVVDGRSLAAPVESGLADPIAVCRIADFQPGEYINPALLRRLDRFTQLSLASVRLAVDDAALSTLGEEERTGSVLTTTHGPFNTTEGYLRTLVESGPNMVSPAQFSSTVTNVATGHISMTYQLKGASSTLTGSSSVTYGLNLLRDQKADVMIAVGAEEYIPTIARAYHKLGLLGNGETGLLIGEGSAALVLESLSHAKARGARIYGEILGYGITCDAVGNENVAVRDPSGAMVAEAFRQAIERAHIEAAQVGCIVSSANGLASHDRAEAAAIQAVFGADQPQRVSVKPVIGDTCGASGIIGVAVGLLALREGLHSYVLSHSAEIGGNNIAILLGHYDA